MATENLSPALRTPASSRPYPKAHPGYGKRSAPEQRPASAEDFMLLPERERYIAGYVDHLPDGAAMDIKTLAKNIPLYGQMAIGSALRALTVAGHLRHARCQVGESGSRWVTLTYWSRTAHDDEWWVAFTEAENIRVTQEAAAAPTAPPPPWAPMEAPATQVTVEAPVAPSEPAPQPALPPPAPFVPQQRTPEPVPSGPSPAYLALAQLGRIEPRLALSAADCAILQELATAWLDRGVNTDYLTHALTSGLPAQVDSPVGFVRRRLRDKIPPHLPTGLAPATPGARVRRLLVECTECGAPGPSEALPDGLCRRCGTPAPGATAETPVDPPVECDIHALVDSLRDLMRTP
ncbi:MULTISPECIES: MarR family transcriptional regulator [unclassified Streptomyces]|uniref:MarR family transcriptional regulator n=1 Tax=unclassified Streptomyces TaxID=2593676 RepID=UPI002DDAB3F4|nr:MULTISPECIES: MarR family transcriptional regulator [unclassified Streptomyces]WSC36121.1 MarR family transcriptional regulator [Streptomyces sp. NBC_01763]